MLGNSIWFEGIETIQISILDQEKFRDFNSQWSSDFSSICLLMIIITTIGDFNDSFHLFDHFSRFRVILVIFESVFYLSFIKKI